jgi:dTDP-4-amino-4,6-dideoxygalactose transaminase
LDGIAGVHLPHFSDSHHFDSYQNYVIRTPIRDELREQLTAQGIETLVHWRKPMWEHNGLELENPRLPKTEAICREVLSLPMSAETTPEHVDITIQAIQQFFSSKLKTVAMTS